MEAIEANNDVQPDDHCVVTGLPVGSLDALADAPAPEQFLGVTFRCGEEDVSDRVAALLPLFLVGPRGRRGSGAAGEFLDACREFAVWAEIAGRKTLADALGTLAAEYRAIHESPLDADDRVMGHLWHRLWPELERLRHFEPPSQKRQRPGMLRVEPQRIDGSLERVANLLVSVELLGDLQGRMATNRQTASLAEEMQGIARDLRTQATELQKSVTGLRQAPASRLLRKVRRTVQALVYSQDCQIEWELAGEDVEIEQALIEEMEAPLTRLLCRLLQQGEQTSPASRAEEPDGSEPLGLGVARNTNQVSFTIQHIGLAIDPQQLADLAAEAGFGADVEIDCRCTPDTGTAVRLTAPVNDVTRAISGLLVVQNGQQFIIPFKHINEVVDVSALRISTVAGSQVATVRQTTYDAVSLGEALGLPSAEATASSARTGAVVVQCRKGTLCLLVDEIIGNRRTVVQGIEKILPGVRMIAGVAPTGQGRLALVVDVPGMVKSRASQ